MPFPELAPLVLDAPPVSPLIHIPKDGRDEDGGQQLPGPPGSSLLDLEFARLGRAVRRREVPSAGDVTAPPRTWGSLAGEPSSNASRNYDTPISQVVIPFDPALTNVERDDLGVDQLIGEGNQERPIVDEAAVRFVRGVQRAADVVQ